MSKGPTRDEHGDLHCGECEHLERYRHQPYYGEYLHDLECSAASGWQVILFDTTLEDCDTPDCCPLLPKE